MLLLRQLELFIGARKRGHKLVAREFYGLGCALLVDELLVGRVLAGLHESSVVVGDDLVRVPLTAVFRAEHLDTA